MPVLHQGDADRLHNARRQDEAGAQHRRQNFGHATALHIAVNQPPDHPERQSVEEQGHDVPRRGDQGEADQSRPGGRDQADDRSGAAARLDLRHDLDPDELGQSVARDLREHDRDLVVERTMPTRHRIERRSGKGFAEGVHRKIGRKAGEPRDQGEDGRMRAGERALHPGARACHPICGRSLAATRAPIASSTGQRSATLSIR